MNKIVAAARFARLAHQTQKRKYTGEPFITHPTRVAMRVLLHEAACENMVVAAFLHDVVEDTHFTFDHLMSRFGKDVVRICKELTNPSKGSKLGRAERKAMDREHLATISLEAKIIKLYDRIDNVNDMDGADDDFKKLYCEESRLLAEVLRDVSETLYGELIEAIERLEGTIE
jgi:(p)ppGpp synthase/HD superfamily hydrolase